MRLPIIPFLVAAILLSLALYVFNSTGPVRRVLDMPRLTRLADIEGIESEVAIAPDGDGLAVIADGDLWLLSLSTSSRRRIAATPERESFPAWMPGGKRITFTRGLDTFILDPETNTEQMFKANATSLSWASTGRIGFVRDRAVWLADSNGQNERQIVEADPSPDVGIGAVRFSPDALQLAFTKSTLNLRGELWAVDVLSGAPRALVADRVAERPLDMGWTMDGRYLVYLTNRAGAYSLWYVDFAESTIMPLTQPLMGVPLARVGIGVLNDRVVLPRHFVDSNIVTSDGSAVAQTENLEFEPAVSPDGRLVAYTVLKNNNFEIWTAGIDGSAPTFRALGREPRFAASGFHIVYTHTDLKGNEDIWRLDLRNADSEQVTDAEEIDVAADASPDGRTIAFSSARGGAVSIWTIPASGGKRLRINNGGYGPRYSRDGRTILFWNNGALWTMTSDGRNTASVFEGLSEPAAGIWTPNGPAFSVGGEIRSPSETLFAFPNRRIWPQFDILPDGRWLVAPLNIHETGLWAVDLVYKEN